MFTFIFCSLENRDFNPFPTVSADNLVVDDTTVIIDAKSWNDIPAVCATDAERCIAVASSFAEVANSNLLLQ